MATGRGHSSPQQLGNTRRPSKLRGIVVGQPSLRTRLSARQCRRPMYERFVWTFPKRFRKPIKALAGLLLRSSGRLLNFPPSMKHRLARALSFRFRAAAAVLDAVPADQVERCVLFVSLKPHTREAKMAE